MEETKFTVPAKFWSEERNLTWLLVALILDLFILDPLMNLFTTGLAVSVINTTAFAILLLLGLLTLTRHRVTQIVFAGITAVSISVRVGLFVFGKKWLLVWDVLLTMICLITFVIVLLIYVYQESPVTRHRIRGAIATYLLITIVFAFGTEAIRI